MQRMDVASNMRLAFMRALPKRNLNKTQAFIHKALTKGIGIKSVSEWNAHLSFNTAKELKEQGILP